MKRLNLNHEYRLPWYLIESECFVLFCLVGFFEDKIERFFGWGAFLSRRRHFFEIKIDYFFKVEVTFLSWWDFLSILSKIKISVHFLSIVLNFYFLPSPFLSCLFFYFSPEPLIFSRSNLHFHRSRFLRRAFQSLLTRAFNFFRNRFLRSTLTLL